MSPADPRASASACSSEAWAFAELEAFWTRYRPLTPRGRDRREDRLVYAEPRAIGRSLDLTEAWLAFEDRVGKTGPALDRIAWHLGRIPRLPPEFSYEARDMDGDASRPGEQEPRTREPRTFDLVELFQVKKFLANQRAVAELLDPPAREAFCLVPACDGLAAELGRGGSDAESLWVADCWHPRLRGIRESQREIDTRAAELRARDSEAVKRNLGLDFRGRDFLLVPPGALRRPEGAADEGSPDLAVEPYDATFRSVRLLPGEEALALDEARSRLLDEEALATAEVVAWLSGLALAAAGEVAAAVDALCELDLARARAALAREEAMTRPVLAAGSGVAALIIEAGRHLPRKAACEALGVAYRPLDFRLDAPACVLSGSNMGGKTVALKTILFLQVLAQAGFHVPAARFSSQVHAHIHYVGGLDGFGQRGDAGGRCAGRGNADPRDAEGEAGGLSGFGFEIRAFDEAWRNAAEGGFAVFDEFARTTGSREAEAILSAVVGALAGKGGARSLFSTHFRGIARLRDVRYFRMKGLDREAARKSVGAAREAMGERIRRINGLMEYRVVEDLEGRAAESDAILVAGLLGMDEGIVTAATRFHDDATGIRKGKEGA